MLEKVGVIVYHAKIRSVQDEGKGKQDIVSARIERRGLGVFRERLAMK